MRNWTAGPRSRLDWQTFQVPSQDQRLNLGRRSSLTRSNGKLLVACPPEQPTTLQLIRLDAPGVGGKPARLLKSIVKDAEGHNWQAPDHDLRAEELPRGDACKMGRADGIG
jgi:hypothetical protein